MRITNFLRREIERLIFWVKIMFEDELPTVQKMQDHRDGLFPEEFFYPQQRYSDQEIKDHPEIIIHNHLATLHDDMRIMGRAMERVWFRVADMEESLGLNTGVLGIIKRIVVGVAVAGVVIWLGYQFKLSLK